VAFLLLNAPIALLCATGIVGFEAALN